MLVVSCLVQFFMFFHPFSSSTQQRPALCSEWGWDAFLTLHLDLRGTAYSDTKFAQSMLHVLNVFMEYFPLGFKLPNLMRFCTSNHPVFCFQVQTLLVFFNRMWFHWPMMSIHLASRCLTNSGAGPTFLRQDNVDNSPLAGWLVCQSADVFALCTFVISDTGSALKIKKGNRKTTVRQFYVPMVTGKDVRHEVRKQR